MAYIYLDPVGLQGFINDLDGRAGDFQRFSVSTYRMASERGWPTDIDGMVGDGSTTSRTAAVLADEAAGLQTRLDEAVQMNNDGVTIFGPNGTVCYYLPDGAADTPETVVDYNSRSLDNGRHDASSLNQALNSETGEANDGRTVDEILAEMAKHRDVPVYGAVFVRTFGVDRYLDLPVRLAEYYHSNYDDGSRDNEFVAARDTMGHVLGAASQDEIGGADLVSGVNLAVTNDVETGSGNGAYGLNMMMAAPGVVYGTGFLVGTADSMEKIDPGSVPPYTGEANHYMTTEFGYGHDPLVGAVSAMGNNSEAALLYLTPDGKPAADGTWQPGQQSQDRWKMLTERWEPSEDSWGQLGDAGLERRGDALSALTAAASSYRGGGDAEDAPANAQARSTWVAGEAITYFVDEYGQDGYYDTVTYTETTKQNLAVLAANCSEEYSHVANGEVLKPDASEGSADEGVDTGLGVGREYLDTLLYRIVDNENAAATVAAGMGEWHHNHTEETMPSTEDPAGTLRDEYQDAAATMSYLNGIAERRATADEEAQEDSRENMGTALSVFSTVLGAGVSAVTGGAASPAVAAGVPLATDAGTTIAQPIIAVADPDEAVELSARYITTLTDDEQRAKAKATLEATNALYGDDFGRQDCDTWAAMSTFLAEKQITAEAVDPGRAHTMLG